MEVVATRKQEARVHAYDIARGLIHGFLSAGGLYELHPEGGPYTVADLKKIENALTALALDFHYRVQRASIKGGDARARTFPER